MQSLPTFEALPEAFIHTDVAPTNAIERQNGDLTFIDWDDAGVGTRVLDVGFPLIQQFVSEERQFLERNARAFYGAYFSRMKLTDEEMRHIFPAALLIALMYIKYGDTLKRWRRIEWAIENRGALDLVVNSAAKA